MKNLAQYLTDYTTQAAQKTGLVKDKREKKRDKNSLTNPSSGEEKLSYVETLISDCKKREQYILDQRKEDYKKVSSRVARIY